MARVLILKRNSQVTPSKFRGNSTSGLALTTAGSHMLLSLRAWFSHVQRGAGALPYLSQEQEAVLRDALMKHGANKAVGDSDSLQKQ